MRGIKKNLFILAFAALALVLGAWLVQKKITSDTRINVGHSLETIRDTTHQAIRTWYKNEKTSTEVHANTKLIRELAIQLLALPPKQSALLNSPAQQQLRDWFQDLQKVTHYKGYFIVGPNHINLASSRDQNIGAENLLVDQKDFLSGIWSGRPAVSLPVRSDVPIKDSHNHLISGLPSIFVGAPILNNAEKVIAIFMFRLDPEEGFTNILKLGRIGKTGETYAFDSEGRLISHSRFDDQLNAFGLIPPTGRGILSIRLRDPGVNLVEDKKPALPREQLPLTRMAISATQGETGIDTDGYRDYRGVPVVGAWLWDNELGMGLSTELDEKEAYQALRATQHTIAAFTIFSFLLLAGLTVIYTLFRHRKIVEEELRRAATVFDNTDEAIIITNSEAEIIQVNKAFTVITGYEAVEVLGRNPRFQHSGNHDPEFYEAMWDTLNSQGQWRGEIWNQRKNGEIYPAWENINVVKDEQGQIKSYVAIFSDISILKESEDMMTHLAHHDTLTGLPNRMHFIVNLEQAIEGAKRNKRNTALLFLDLDNFKNINDRLGHNAGDDLLKIIAERLKSCVRAEDTVARLGGDEFTVILTDVAHAEDAGLIAVKIIRAIRQPVKISGETIGVSASVGISIFPDDGIDDEGMLKAADIAMYHAKTEGKDNFQYFTADLASRSSEHALIEKDLRKAIDYREFELYYQPQISLANGKINGVEALIRWNHPEKGLILPDTFIHIADDSGLIDEICEWVLRTAFDDHKRWSTKDSPGPRIAINVTWRQITREQSIQHILSVVEELAPEPDILQLNLEITEAALEHTKRTISIINTLNNRGVMFAIDNFGTGHSSLSRLKELPVDTIKIDRSFIHHITENNDDKEITAAIIAMAHNLGLRVIGEAVETRAQYEALLALDCDEIQGFYFSKPVPVREIERMLEKTFQGTNLRTGLT